MTKWVLASMADWDLETWWFYIKYCFVVVLILSAIAIVKELFVFFFYGGDSTPPPTPMCPNCHGFNTGKITAIKRVLEHSTFGWASPSSGNTFECYDCGYKW